MMRVLKAAFWLRYPVPGLGGVPVNLVGLACLGLLGFGNPGFWLAGLGLETTYLALLATNPRFQRWAEIDARSSDREDLDAKRRTLLQQLTSDDQRAIAHLSDRCARIEALWRSHEDSLFPGNEQTLRDLQWTYLKLLIARQHVLGSERESDESRLAVEIDGLQRALDDPHLSATARDSKSATLALLRRRVENTARRRQMLEEIQSDLSRIEAQVALVLENATLEGKPQAVSAELDLASRLLDGSFFGSAADDVAALDAAYGRKAAGRVTE
jgi:hypothetical protein